MAIIIDDIQNVEQMDLPGKVHTIYEYIRYMKEQIEFWGQNRGREINSLNQAVGSLTETVYKMEPDKDFEMQIPVSGFVTANGTVLVLLAPIMTGEYEQFDMSSLMGGIRVPAGGYLQYQDSEGNPTETRDNTAIMYDEITVTVLKDSGIRLRLVCTTGWLDPDGNTINNIPVTGQISITGVFS